MGNAGVRGPRARLCEAIEAAGNPLQQRDSLLGVLRYNAFSLLGERDMRFWTQDSQQTHHTVRQDWRAPLSSEKWNAYQFGIELIEPLHLMFGVALNEAIELKNHRNLSTAREQVGVSRELCHRLVSRLSTVLLRLESHARHFGTLPSVEPLEADNFRGAGPKNKARMNAMLSTILWSQQNRYVQKVRALEDLVNGEEEGYAISADRIIENSSVSPRFDWEMLDAVHYDLSTAVSETKILLKCFLVAVPDIEVRHFHRQLGNAITSSEEFEFAPPPAARAELNGRADAFLRQ